MKISDLEKKPKVSIVLCTYNGSKYLKEQLKSIINQSYKNFEIIISDDKSVDNTCEIINSMLNQAEIDYSLYINTEQLGFYRNFEKGISLASGEFIALCDQDDIWNEKKIEILISEIGDNAMIYSDSIFIDDSGVPKGNSMSDIVNMVDGRNHKKLVFHNSVSAHAMLFKKELIPLILPFPDLPFHDWWIAFVAMSKGGIKYIDQKLVNYRVHQNNATEIDEFINQHKPKGKKIKKWDAFKNLKLQAGYLDTLRLHGHVQNDMKKFLYDYKNFLLKRQNQLISIRFFILWIKNYNSLSFCVKNKDSNKSKYLLQKLFGLKLKRLHYQFNNKL
jgi:glycosyltransferase involved in cell wall biosynthesis